MLSWVGIALMAAAVFTPRRSMVGLRLAACWEARS